MHVSITNVRNGTLSPTRISPNKVKMITKNKDGGTWDIMRTQMANGDHMWDIKDNKKGLECKMFYEKFTCMDGTWKPVCIEGAEEFAKAMGKIFSRRSCKQVLYGTDSNTYGDWSH